MEQTNQKFKLTMTVYVIEWKDMAQAPNIEETILAALQSVLDHVYADGHPQDLVNIEIYHPVLLRSIGAPFAKLESLTADKIADIIEEEDADLDFNSDLRLTFKRLDLR